MNTPCVAQIKTAGVGLRHACCLLPPGTRHATCGPGPQACESVERTPYHARGNELQHGSSMLAGQQSGTWSQHKAACDVLEAGAPRQHLQKQQRRGSCSISNRVARRRRQTPLQICSHGYMPSGRRNGAGYSKLLMQQAQSSGSSEG